jgi:glutamine synthetase type III
MAKNQEKNMSTVADIYGQNVFSLKTMRNYLSEKAYNSLLSTVRKGNL